MGDRRAEDGRFTHVKPPTADPFSILVPLLSAPLARSRRQISKLLGLTAD
jgi:hypothetical protein